VGEKDNKRKERRWKEEWKKKMEKGSRGMKFVFFSHSIEIKKERRLIFFVQLPQRRPCPCQGFFMGFCGILRGGTGFWKFKDN
jgi:hypothetical protein